MVTGHSPDAVQYTPQQLQTRQLIGESVQLEQADGRLMLHRCHVQIPAAGVVMYGGAVWGVHGAAAAAGVEACPTAEGRQGGLHWRRRWQRSCDLLRQTLGGSRLPTMQKLESA